MKLTPKRRAWLELLRDRGPHERSKSNIGYYCMQAGWTDWNYRSPEGDQMTPYEARARYGDKFWEVVEFAGERLTEAGRKVLEQ